MQFVGGLSARSITKGRSDARHPHASLRLIPPYAPPNRDWTQSVPASGVGGDAPPASGIGQSIPLQKPFELDESCSGQQ